MHDKNYKLFFGKFYGGDFSVFILFISNENYYSFFLPQMTHMNSMKRYCKETEENV
jgi:hypothetical protein